MTPAAERGDSKTGPLQEGYGAAGEPDIINNPCAPWDPSTCIGDKRGTGGNLGHTGKAETGKV